MARKKIKKRKSRGVKSANQIRQQSPAYHASAVGDAIMEIAQAKAERPGTTGAKKAAKQLVAHERKRIRRHFGLASKKQHLDSLAMGAGRLKEILVGSSKAPPAPLGVSDRRFFSEWLKETNHYLKQLGGKSVGLSGGWAKKANPRARATAKKVKRKVSKRVVSRSRKPLRKKKPAKRKKIVKKAVKKRANPKARNKARRKSITFNNRQVKLAGRLRRLRLLNPDTGKVTDKYLPTENLYILVQGDRGIFWRGPLRQTTKLELPDGMDRVLGNARVLSLEYDMAVDGQRVVHEFKPQGPRYYVNLGKGKVYGIIEPVAWTKRGFVN